MKELKPNNHEEEYTREVKIFLAGSIEMGNAEDWQKNVVQHFESFQNVVFYNPKRDSWDSSWKQCQTDTNFNCQVNWELDHLDRSDVIFMNFLPETRSPISLLELGLYASSGKMIVCCPEGFWRKGNVEIVCTKYNVPMYENFNKAIGALYTKVRILL